MSNHSHTQKGEQSLFEDIVNLITNYVDCYTPVVMGF